MKRLSLSLAILLTLGGCRDAVAPRVERVVAAPQFERVGDLESSDADQDSTDALGTSILHQAATAPQLETYQVSFWLSRERATQVMVRYQPAAGESQGAPFLLFDVPKDGLRTAGGGAKLARQDSVLITLTIDPRSFEVDFQPSGVLFSQRKPATLVFWYQNADPDLNGDGVVNNADRDLEKQLHIIYRRNGRAHWQQTKSMRGWDWPYVLAPVRHFSSYAVSW